MVLGLLEKNKFVKQKWLTAADIKAIENLAGIDYFLEFIDDRVYHNNTEPRIKPKSYGYKVIILRSGTGTGKSALIAPQLYKKYIAEGNIDIVLTQPTRVNTIDITKQICKHNADLIIGVNIGYQTGTQMFKPNRGILICTIGILLQALKNWTDNIILNRYNFILIDEVHMRTLEYDSTLFLIKKFLERNWQNPKCPLIILMSGTFDPSAYLSYFNVPKEHFLDVIPGTSYHMDVIHTPFAVSNYIRYTVDLVEKIHIENIEDVLKGESYRHILVFVQGTMQVDEIVDELHRLNTQVFRRGLEYSVEHMESRVKDMNNNYGSDKTGGDEVVPYYIIPIPLMSKHIDKGESEYINLYSRITNIYVNIYEFDENNKRTEKILANVSATRKVIVGTNVVETGITISELKYCIDTGFVTSIYFNPCVGCKINTSCNITKASSVQRMGRVARDAPGKAYLCYTKDVFEKLPNIIIPEINKNDISSFLLNVIINETETRLFNLGTDQGYSGNEDMTLDENGDWVAIGKYGKIHLSEQIKKFQMNKFDQRYFEIRHVGEFNAQSMSFMQYPSADSFEYSLEKLHGLGFINYNYEVTFLGYYANKFRKLDIESTRMILAGYQYGCNIMDLITIAAFLQLYDKLGIKRKKYRPANPLGCKTESEALHDFQLLFADEFIEYLWIYENIMDEIEKIGDGIRKHSQVHGGKQHRTRKSKEPKKINIKHRKVTNTTKAKNKYLSTVDKYNLYIYCKTHRLKLDGILAIIELRTEIIEDMLTIGLNPYYNGLGLSRGKYNLRQIIRNNLAEGMDEITKIKKCIYEGYRFNLCVWDSTKRVYINNYLNIPIVIDSLVIYPVIKASNPMATPEMIEIMRSEYIQHNPKYILIGNMMMRESYTNRGIFELSGDCVSVMDGFVDVDVSFIYN